jgi:adenylate cyclase
MRVEVGREMEVERKFLVKSLPPGWKSMSCSRIRQGYFSLRGKVVEIRLREKSSQCFITIKAGRGTIRLEEEIPISRQRFKRLWPLVRAATVVKTRYRIPHRGRTIELDVYQGHHRGLMTAEVEFAAPRSAKSFEPPRWLGREITGNRRYANESLAHRGRV